MRTANCVRGIFFYRHKKQNHYATKSNKIVFFPTEHVLFITWEDQITFLPK